MPYPFKEIEAKWQKEWAREGLFETKEKSSKPKFYCLDMFPYPSSDGLHVGHPRGYTATDVLAHYYRMNGYNVLHPMGWDAFGLPAENYAIKLGIHPDIITKQNIANFKRQMQMLGFSYDWSREINTTDPKYYKWTQWIFLKMFQRGLAYQKEASINFCPRDKTGLANEEVVAGRCERCGTKVVKKRLRQWMLKITAYADRLLKDLELLDWPESIKTMQRNWIGKSEGAEILFPLQNSKHVIRTFTTRPDTLFGATYLVLAPEHELAMKIATPDRKKEVNAYVHGAIKKLDIERQVRTKDGVFTGAYATNPATNERIPIWIAEYVLTEYGTGAIMAVPAHDERDFAFAKAHNLPIIQVISPIGKAQKLKEAYINPGIILNSGEFSGKRSTAIKDEVTAWLKTKKMGGPAVQYHLRDWIFSRQRYWGEPIPMIHCKKCGTVPVPEDDLPVLLPKIEKFEPTGTGESPLSAITSWMNTTCPNCSGPAKRETNTMPQWAGSCWYYLRFIDPENSKVFVDKEKGDTWLPVDLYVGGAEHAVLHLLYARFWHKVLYDEKLTKHLEPFRKLINVGLILAPDGQKMSKSRGNVINPDDLVEKYGADAFRLYELFIGPFTKVISWDQRGIEGTFRFLNKVWRLKDKVNKTSTSLDLELRNSEVVAKIQKNIPSFRFNTSISAMMTFVNYLGTRTSVPRQIWETLLKLLAPFAPHIASELWQRAGNTSHIFSEPFPVILRKGFKQTEQLLIVQVDGKVRGQIRVPSNISKEKVIATAQGLPNIQAFLHNRKSKKVVYVPNKIINFVLSE